MNAKRIKGYEDLDDTMICYWKAKADEGDHWLLYFPRCGVGNLKNHSVTENADGTITVTPSILTTGHDNGKETTVHGYLMNGVWKDC